MSYIPRLAEKGLESALSTKELHRDVILIEGARQVGKTSLIKHLCLNRPHLWIDFEQEKAFLRKIDTTQSFEEFADLLAAEKNFTPGQGKILVIDESQESRVLGSYVRYLKEIWQNQTVILMGSLMARLFREGVRFPVGRTRSIKIFPFTFEEFLRALGEEALLKKISRWEPKKPLTAPFHEKAMRFFLNYLTIGGLPEVVQLYAAKKNWEEKLKNLAFGYSEDFKRVEGEEKTALFELALKRMSQTLGSQSKLSTIVASHQPGYRLLPDIINLLENWMLIHKIEVETPASPGVSRVPPKRYLFDHGVRQAFSPVMLRIPGMDEEKTNIDWTYLGGIFENAVLNELKPFETEKTVSWRKAINGSEVDFLFTKDQKIIPIEVKAAVKINQHYLSGLLQYLEFSGGKKALLISGGSGDVYSLREKTIIQVPFYAVPQGVQII